MTHAQAAAHNAKAAREAERRFWETGLRKHAKDALKWWQRAYKRAWKANEYFACIRFLCKKFEWRDRLRI